MLRIAPIGCFLLACQSPDKGDGGTIELDDEAATLWEGTADAYGYEGLPATVTITPYLVPPRSFGDPYNTLYDDYETWAAVHIAVDLPELDEGTLATGVWSGQLGSRVHPRGIRLLAYVLPEGGSCLDQVPPHEFGPPHVDYAVEWGADRLTFDGAMAFLSCFPPSPIRVAR